MTSKQIIAIIAPPLLMGSTFLIFRFLNKFLPHPWGWFLGLVSYWILWGALFPLWMIGKEGIFQVIKPQKPTWQIIGLLAIPILGSLAYKLVPGMNFHQTDPWLAVMMVSTAFGNGFFEELLWRGTYLKLFPNRLFWRLVWPGIWFALWHYVPGSISPDGNLVSLMAGSAMFAVILGLLAWKSKSAFWGILAHTIGGLIMTR